MAARPRTTSPVAPNCSDRLFCTQQPQGSLETQRQTCPHPISGSVASLSLQDPTPSLGERHPGSLCLPLSPSLLPGHTGLLAVPETLLARRPCTCCCPLHQTPLPPTPRACSDSFRALYSRGRRKGGPSRQRGPTGEAGQTQPGPAGRSVRADTLTDQARSPASKVRWCQREEPSGRAALSVWPPTWSQGGTCRPSSPLTHPPDLLPPQGLGNGAPPETSRLTSKPRAPSGWAAALPCSPS